MIAFTASEPSVGKSRRSGRRERALHHRLAQYVGGAWQRTAPYVGGLDEPKRIGFLMETGRAVHESIPGFQLIVVGGGARRGVVDRAAAESAWLHYVGRVDTVGKAAIGLVADVMMCPTRWVTRRGFVRD